MHPAEARRPPLTTAGNLGGRPANAISPLASDIYIAVAYIKQHSKTEEEHMLSVMFFLSCQHVHGMRGSEETFGVFRMDKGCM